MHILVHMASAAGGRSQQPTFGSTAKRPPEMKNLAILNFVWSFTLPRTDLATALHDKVQMVPALIHDEPADIGSHSKATNAKEREFNSYRKFTS